MQSYDTLTVRIRGRGSDQYAVELSLISDSTDSEDVLLDQPSDLLQLDKQVWTSLQSKENEPLAYGKLLGKLLFGHPKRTAWLKQTIAAARVRKAILRIRIMLLSDAVELHRLRWETLRDPESGALFAATGGFAFSRYLASEDQRSPRLRPRAETHALIAVAAPTDAEEKYKLAPIQADQEFAIPRAALPGLEIKELGGLEPATLDKLKSELNNSPYIFYLVAHGVIDPVKNKPILYLQKPDGETDWQPASSLIASIEELPEKPRLAILISCYSAGAGDNELPHSSSADSARANQVLMALAPRLVAAGIPAVIGSSGPLFMETASVFVTELFASLARDQPVDIAVASARAMIKPQEKEGSLYPDWWAPVLFLRLHNGQIWQQDDAQNTDRDIVYGEQVWRWLPDYFRLQSDGDPLMEVDRAERVRELTEALLRCPSSRSLDWREFSHLHNLIQALRVHDRGRAELGELYAVLGRIYMFEVSWQRVADLLDMLQHPGANDHGSTVQPCHPGGGRQTAAARPQGLYPAAPEWELRPTCRQRCAGARSGRLGHHLCPQCRPRYL